MPASVKTMDLMIATIIALDLKRRAP